ncbi:hypothetical protein GQ457_15G013590 [Hibiscus cannabinus]
MESRNKVQTIIDSGKNFYFMGLAYYRDRMFTPEYDFWRHAKVNEKVPLPSTAETKSLEEYLKVVPSEANILRNKLKRAEAEIKALQGKHERDLNNASLDVEKARGETKQVRKMYEKMEKNYEIQNVDLIKFQTIFRNVDLRKNPKQWEEEK